MDARHGEVGGRRRHWRRAPVLQLRSMNKSRDLMDSAVTTVTDSVLRP